MIDYTNPWFQVVREGGNYWAEEPAAEHGAAVLPLVGERVLLERQRPAQKGVTTWEIPRGYAERGEDALACARRELAEETGLHARESHMYSLGWVRPNTAILTSCVTLFIATLPADTPCHARDAEALDFHWLAVKDIPQCLASGRLEDGFTLAGMALFMAR
ncbi:NUDIX hydrolase [Halomonas sp. Bachu 37]|uniref:NUDIX hydrolase n=1 Tax=Halomonas kashgarensis TaxID=3084920 RepID=UPI003217880D